MQALPLQRGEYVAFQQHTARKPEQKQKTTAQAEHMQSVALGLPRLQGQEIDQRGADQNQDVVAHDNAYRLGMP